MSEQPLVSVIVQTYNSEKTLAQCLKSIKNQTYNNIEIIIVDECSEDETIHIAEKYSSRIFVTETERAKQKNLGIREARGMFICFIDSDMQLTPRVIEECRTAIDVDEKIGGIIIPEISVGDSLLVKIRDFERSFYAGSVIESARFFRKDLVEIVGGFDEKIIFYEDSILPLKIEQLGFLVTARINAEILHHEEDLSLWKHLKKKFIYGKTLKDYKEKYKKYANRQLGIFYRSRLFLTKRFVRKPMFGLIVLMLKMLEYAFCMIGSLTSKINQYEQSENK